MLAAFELEGAIMPRPTRQRVALIGLAVGILIAGSLIAGSSAAGRRGSVVDRLRELLAGLVDRVEAIEQTDCGCPGLLEPVCANGRTWQNMCEANCALGRLADPPLFLQYSEGPCDPAQQLCEDFACAEGHTCIDGVCSRGQCEGRPGFRNDCRTSGCARGYHCATYPEVGCIASACTCDPRSGATLCTTDCSGSICVPDDGDRLVTLPPGSLDLEAPTRR
jgi:hypothetical protein